MNTDRLALCGGPRSIPEGAFSPWPEVNEADCQALVQAARSGSHMGAHSEEIPLLEREWNAWLGTEYALACNSGTAALHMAVAAVGVQPGDEVIVTALSWTSSATCILHHNAIPVFVDVNPKTFNIDPLLMEDAISERTKALIVVHLYGGPADMEPLMEIARRRDLAVIEDCCQAHGAKFKGKRVGTFGDAAAFSLNQNKVLSAGEGGLLVCKNEEIWQKAAQLQQFGEVRRIDGVREWEAIGMGWMYRMNAFTAAFARSQLTRLHAINERMIQNAEWLRAGLDGIAGLHAPAVVEGGKHIYYAFPIRFQPDEMGIDCEPLLFTRKVRRALLAEGMEINRWETVIPAMALFQERIGYGRGCPWRCFSSRVDYDVAQWPTALDVANRIASPAGLTPPNGPEQIELLVRTFRKVFAQLDVVLDHGRE